MQLLHARSSGSVKRQPIEAHSIHNDTRRQIEVGGFSLVAHGLGCVSMNERCVIDRVIGLLLQRATKRTNPTRLPQASYILCMLLLYRCALLHLVQLRIFSMFCSCCRGYGSVFAGGDNLCGGF